MDLPVEVRRIPKVEGGGYCVVIPSLGESAFVGDGDTVEEAYANLRVASAEILAEYSLHGG